MNRPGWRAALHAWICAPLQSWPTGLKLIEKVLDEAIEEASVDAPISPPEPSPYPPRPQLVVNVQNHNVFSPAVHVSISQLVQQLDTLGLSDAERGVAAEQLHELHAETEGQKRWPVIARLLESVKSLGKDVYKNVAVPLIVEFLKKEAGLPGQ